MRQRRVLSRRRQLVNVVYRLSMAPLYRGVRRRAARAKPPRAPFRRVGRLALGRRRRHVVFAHRVYEQPCFIDAHHARNAANVRWDWGGLQRSYESALSRDESGSGSGSGSGTRGSWRAMRWRARALAIRASIGIGMGRPRRRL
jgi:hypothetical protein